PRGPQAAAQRVARLRPRRRRSKRRCDSTSAERAAQERVRSKLRTWAAAPDGAQALAVWASGSSPRAGPVSWQPCARVGRLPPSRGSCARMVFHTPCDASSHEKRPPVASFSSPPLALDRRCCRERVPAKCFPIVLLALRCAPLMQRSTCFEILRRLLAAVADHFIFHRLTLVERGQPGTLDRGDMDEYISAAALGLNES